MSKLKIGFTGPSLFLSKVQSMIEEEFDAIPIYICQNKQEDLEFILDNLDGIVLAGGKDICPTSYGEEITNFNNLSSFDEDRDLREFFIIDYAFQKNIPILGICRGHQMLAVYHGISLIQDISNSQICHNPSNAEITIKGPVHFVTIKEEYKKEFWGIEYCNSWHHQAVPLLSEEQNPDITPIGYAVLSYKKGSSDVILEVMKGKNKNWLSVQFHPETDYQTNKASQIIVNKFKKMIKK